MVTLSLPRDKAPQKKNDFATLQIRFMPCRFSACLSRQQNFMPACAFSAHFCSQRATIFEQLRKNFLLIFLIKISKKFISFNE